MTTTEERPRAPVTELRRGGRHLVWLDPARYTATERMFIAARVTRSFLTPDKMLSAYYAKHTADEMKGWLRKEIVSEYHDSVQEFAGLEYTLWISGVSLGTIRDVDRHRRFSFEELTTRALGEALKKQLPLLEAVAAGNVFTSMEHVDALVDLFYIHPSMQADCGYPAVQEYLQGCAQALLFYVKNTQDSAKPYAADIYRGALPLALRTPFLMGGNQRDWFEAGGKRTCHRVGHREYVELFRDVLELLHPVAPFVVESACRWCPAQQGEACCRKAWERGLCG